MTTSGVTDSVAAARERLGAQWFRDGVNEIGMGIGALGFAAICYTTHRQMTTGRAEWPMVALAFLGLAISVSEGRVRKYLREHVSYPRIGYVSEVRGEPMSPRRKGFVAVFMVVMLVLPMALMGYLVTHREMTVSFFAMMRWMPLLGGPMMLAAAVWDMERFKLRRLWIGGIILAVAGPLISILVVPPFLAWTAFALALAAVNIVSGAVVLASLARRIPIATE